MGDVEALAPTTGRRLTSGDPASVQKVADRGKGGVREFLLDNLIVAVTQVLMKLRGLLALPLIVKTLGTASFGLWTQVLTVVTFGGAILGANLHLPLVRFVAGKTADAGRIYTTTLVTTILMGASGALLLVPWSDSIAGLLLGGTEHGELLRASAVLLLLQNVRLLNVNLYRAVGKFMVRSIVDFSSAMLELVGVLVVLWAGHGLREVLLFMVAWNALVVSATTLHALRIVGVGRPDLALARQALRYGLPLLPGTIAWVAIDRSDRFVIGAYGGPKEVGVYSAAYALGAIVAHYQVPFQITLLPRVAQLWETDRIRVKRYIELCTKAFLAVAVPTVVGMPIVAPITLRKLANEEIASRSASVATVVGVGLVFLGLSVMQTQVFHGAKRTGVTGAAMTLAAAINIVLTFVLVPMVGIVGAAWATVAGYFSLYVALAVLARPLMRLDLQLAFLAKVGACSAAMFAVLWWVRPMGMARLLIALVPAVLVYFVGLYLLLSKEERAALARLTTRGGA